MAELGAWNELLDELARSAPRTRAAIRPPASPGSISDAEQRLGLQFSDELRAWFGLHGGCDPWPGAKVLPFNAVLDATRAADQTLMIREIWADSPYATDEFFYEEEDAEDDAEPTGEIDGGDVGLDPAHDEFGDNDHSVTVTVAGREWLIYEGPGKDVDDLDFVDDDPDVDDEVDDDGSPPDWPDEDDDEDEDTGPPKQAGTIAGTWLPES